MCDFLDTLTRLLLATDQEFLAIVNRMPKKQARKLVEALDVADCKCEPPCCSMTYRREPVPGSPGYKMCPYARDSIDHGITDERMAILLCRAYGKKYTGPQLEPPVAPQIASREARVALLANRHRSGYRLWREDEHRDKSLVLEDLE